MSQQGIVQRSANHHSNVKNLVKPFLSVVMPVVEAVHHVNKGVYTLHARNPVSAYSFVNTAVQSPALKTARRALKSVRIVASTADAL